MTLLLTDVGSLLPSGSPWETLGGHDELATVTFLRGAILGCYGFVETQLNEIAIRSSRIEEYYKLQAKFPWKFADRMNYLSKAFSVAGILKDIAPDGKKLVKDFVAMQNHRNKWAHGALAVMPGDRSNRWNGSWITLKNFNPADKQFDFTTDRWTGQQIIEQAMETKRLASRSNSIHAAVVSSLPKV